MSKHELPALPFVFDALEPYMDAKTVEIHWGKHHKTYVDKLNLALEKYSDLFDKTIEDLLIDLNAVPVDIRNAVRNFGGGHANHSLFWKILSPKKTKCSGKIADALNKTFGNFEEFKKQFSDKSLALFGSGWVWLVVDLKTKNLEIISTLNQDSPLSLGKKPILVIDLWEHAYYLKYQNRRNEFIESWWNLVNWNKVEELFSL
ncbi:superoxide dismutase [Candidatus Pacearchaeota archaeon]|nr:superoxide dismutase [Candidatus Pacearchaeota archaeon]